MPDGRDRNVDWFYCGQEMAQSRPRQSGRRGRVRLAAAGAAVAAAAAACPTGASTSFTTTTATLTCRRCRCARSPTGTAPRIRRSCTTCTKRRRCCTPTAAAPPQNPNLDPLLFAELPFFSNWELAQMTKWGMPGVYTHAFMDGWSPGYLGSVAYNHNGMMKMYETQSGVDTGRGGGRGAAGDAGGGGARPAAGDAGRAAGAAAAQPVAVAAAAAAEAAAVAVAEAAALPGPEPAGLERPDAGAGRRGDAAGRRGQSAAGRRRPGGRARRRAAGRRTDRPRRRTRIASGTAAFRCRRTPRRTSRAATTRTTWRPACSRRSSSRRCSRTSSSRTSTSKTQNSIDAGQDERAVRVRDSRTARHDEAGRARPHPARCRASKSAGRPRSSRSATTTYPAGSYVIKRDQPYWPAREEPARESRSIPTRRCTTYDDSGWTMGLAMLVDVKEIDRQGDPRRATTPLVTEFERQGQRSTGIGQRRPRRRALRLEQHDLVPLPAEERRR